MRLSRPPPPGARGPAALCLASVPHVRQASGSGPPPQRRTRRRPPGLGAIIGGCRRCRICRETRSPTHEVPGGLPNRTGRTAAARGAQPARRPGTRGREPRAGPPAARGRGHGDHGRSQACRHLREGRPAAHHLGDHRGRPPAQPAQGARRRARRRRRAGLRARHRWRRRRPGGRVPRRVPGNHEHHAGRTGGAAAGHRAQSLA